ncbi:MAG: 3TM-type holin [Candidatus Thorarchaeota archaeon]
MGILSKIFGVGEAAVAPITAVGSVLDNLFTSEDEKLTHEEVRMRLALQPDMAQIELNKIEAGHRSIFVAGWRPFIGWVCGIGLANTFLVNPWLQWVSGKAGPELPHEVMMELVFALLGLGTLRTIDKIRGKSK